MEEKFDFDLNDLINYRRSDLVVSMVADYHARKLLEEERKAVLTECKEKYVDMQMERASWEVVGKAATALGMKSKRYEAYDRCRRLSHCLLNCESIMRRFQPESERFRFPEIEIPSLEAIKKALDDGRIFFCTRKRYEDEDAVMLAERDEQNEFWFYPASKEDGGMSLEEYLAISTEENRLQDIERFLKAYKELDIENFARLVKNIIG